ncbi:MlaD family protein [Magnetospirillum molischianum]|uniref:ABC-type transport system involved in resistance to organic solvents, periplasmic component n=1 Tax=Magnetospirillum molischianum DSM 120 TaxID=1150626 RepID=H8FPR3_MAGML|nr:MlaD family protein [Magnetospirillum molischianum]CCG40351.1 ABC-type transport system involved in resistance to organic solvents, periplasmic component [Magnetospirillum molischianum DSM 120]
MVSRSDRDAVIGGGVLIIGALSMMLVFFVGDQARKDENSFSVTARFNRADGIVVGSPVRLSGAPIGFVAAQALDDKYRALLTLNLRGGVHLPADSTALIHTDGLLGAKYIELRPGGDDALLKPGQEIEYTQDAVVIEDLLDMIIQQARAKRGYLDKPLPTTSN